MDASPVYTTLQTTHDLAALQSLNQRQLGGLAFLGEIGAKLAEVWQPEFAQPLTEAMQNIGNLFELHDFPGLLEELSSTLNALRQSGLLAFVRNNAVWVSESGEQLYPLLLQGLQTAREIPWDALRQDMATVSTLVSKLHALAEFYEQYWAAHMTEKLVDIGTLWQQQNLDEALLDAAKTLSALHRNGSLALARDLSAMLSDMAQNSGTDNLAASAMQKLEGMQGIAQLPLLLKSLSDVAQAWQHSAEEVHGPDTPKGGLVGMVKLLRNPAVQEFIQRIIVTAQHVEPSPAFDRQGAGKR